MALIAGGAGPVYAESGDDPVPKAPRITSLGPYGECAADPCAGAGGPGMPGRFSFAPDPADTDVTGYRFQLLGAPARDIGAAEAVSSEVIPETDGVHILSVRAKDRGDRWSAPAEFRFKVNRIEDAGRWRFDDGLADPAATVAKDSAPVGEPDDATLHTDGSGWSPLARGGEQDRSLLLDSRDPRKPQEYAATERPVLDTAESFTVSAWAYLTDTRADRVVLSAPGEQEAAFALHYSAAEKKWAFRRGARDEAGTAHIRSLGEASSPPVRVWTHLAGVFDTKYDSDPSNDTVQLFVNGRPQGRPVVAAEAAPSYRPWRATGGLQFGRSRTAGAFRDHFRGRVDEVAVTQWARTERGVRAEAQVTDSGSPATPLVAHWDAAASGGSRLREVSPYPARDMRLSPTGAAFRAEDGSLALDGTSGHAAGSGPVVDETGSFTVSARVRVDGAALEAKPDGYRALVAGQRAGAGHSWALWIRKHGPGAYVWEFSRAALAGDGTPVEVTVSGSEPARTDAWVDLTGVFDAHQPWSSQEKGSGTGQLALYAGFWDVTHGWSGVNRSRQGTGELTAGGVASGGFLPGALKSLRVWTGAMTANEVFQQVVTPEA
ncbi:LamG-like jellyroll fold domain-containing protein [Streptomyces sp. NPDC051310]|uniref:LamG-like jellyroll fold domain-containing protein n=1 Tax=Streptomyces sp. NPDC051310 TaxID=3365649 RepID=UPI00379384DB